MAGKALVEVGGIGGAGEEQSTARQGGVEMGGVVLAAMVHTGSYPIFCKLPHQSALPGHAPPK